MICLKLSSGLPHPINELEERRVPPFAIIGHTVTALLCTTITLIVALQLRHDRKSRAFAGLTGAMAAIAFCGILIRIPGLFGNDGIFELFTIAGVLTGVLPGLLFIFTAEYFNAWTPARRWMARTLIAALTAAAILGVLGQLISRIDVSPEGFLTYTMQPGAAVLLGFAGLGVLFAFHIVLQEYRKNVSARNNQLLAGIGLIGIGILILAVPGLGKYTIEQKFYAIGCIVLVGPVLRQRLIDPLTQLNAKLTHRAEQLSIITRVGQQATLLLSRESLLDAVVQEIQQAFSYQTVTIYLPEKPGSVMMATRAVGHSQTKPERQSEVPIQLALDPEERADLVAKGHALRVNPGNLPAISFALMIGEQMVGILDIEDRQVRTLSPEDLEVFLILARQIAIAIRNAELFEEAEAARQRADEASQHKTDFLSFMSHELRTPLQTIITGSQWMLKNPASCENIALPEPYVPDMQKIINTGRHLHQLIANILDLSRIEAGEIGLTIRPIDPLPILRDVQETYIHSLRNGVVIRAAYSEQLPWVLGDDLRLKQILGNLLANACKFCQRGQITLEAAVQGAMLRFAVIDTGPGIPPDAQPFIFSRFKQASRDVTREYGGTGLGLNIARHLVQLHGGEMDFESVEGQGSTFFFTIPTASAGASAFVRGEPRLLVTFFNSSKAHVPLQILVIDPQPDSRRQLGDLLAKSGYKVFTADSAAKGMVLALATEPFSVIVVIHPDRQADGVMLAQRLRHEEALCETLVIEAPHPPAFDAILEKLSLSAANGYLSV
jgi:signal transduction histidine kinase